MRLAVISILVLFSCTVKKLAKEPKIQPLDSLGAVQPVAVDSTVYIGPLEYFADTKEFYTPLYYSEDVKVTESYDYLIKAVDSLVYAGNDVSRKRLPYEIAKWFFRLDGMDTISMYNASHKKIGDARLVRIELLSGPVNDEFICVFKPVTPAVFTTDVAYCAGASEMDLKTVRTQYEQIRNERIAKKIFEKFGLNERTGIRHAKLTIYNSVYSTLDLDSVCLLLEVRNDQVEIAHESKEDYCIIKLLPTHFEINGKPVLITSMGVRESDVMWTSLAVFSGKQYEFAERCRIKIK